MNTMEYLNQLRLISIVIEQKKNEKKELEDKIYNISSVDNSKLKVKSSRNRNTYTLIDKHIDDTVALENEIISYEHKRKKIINEIRQIKKPEYVDVLYRRYVQFKSFNVIACETGYSISNIYKIHEKALRAFEKLGVNYSKRE